MFQCNVAVNTFLKITITEISKRAKVTVRGKFKFRVKISKT